MFMIDLGETKLVGTWIRTSLRRIPKFAEAPQYTSLLPSGHRSSVLWTYDWRKKKLEAEMMKRLGR